MYKPFFMFILFQPFHFVLEYIYPTWVRSLPTLVRQWLSNALETWMMWLCLLNVPTQNLLMLSLLLMLTLKSRLVTASPRRYILKIHFFIKSGQKMIQFKIQFKTKSKIWIRSHYWSLNDFRWFWDIWQQLFLTPAN